MSKLEEVQKAMKAFEVAMNNVDYDNALENLELIITEAPKLVNTLSEPKENFKFDGFDEYHKPDIERKEESAFEEFKIRLRTLVSAHPTNNKENRTLKAAYQHCIVIANQCRGTKPQ